MSVTGRLSIEVNVWCPECDDPINLMEVPNIIEDGWIHDLVMPKNKHWAGACKNFSKEYLEAFGEDFQCPNCGKVIYIGEILY